MASEEALLERVIGTAAGAARMAAVGGGDVVRMSSRPDDWLDAWDPGYIRTTLPALRAMSKLYFRAEVRGLDNIPAEGPVLLVGNHSGGTLIADTFVFAQALLRPLRPAAPLPPARARPRLQAAGRAGEPLEVRDRAGLARRT